MELRALLSSSSYSPRGGDGIAPAWRASDCVALAEVKAHHGKDAEALVLLGRALDALRVEKGDAHDDTLACAKRVATALRKVADASSRAELEDVVVFAHDALVARHGAKDARTLSAAHDVGVVMRESGRTRDAIRVVQDVRRGEGGGFRRRASADVEVRSISHWFPYDRVGVVNADP